MTNNTYVNDAEGILCITCSYKSYNGEKTTISTEGCFVVRLITVLTLILFFPIIYQILKQYRYSKKLLRPSQGLLYLALICNALYLVHTGIIRKPATYVVLEYFRFILFLFVMMIFNKKANEFAPASKKALLIIKWLIIGCAIAELAILVFMLQHNMDSNGRKCLDYRDPVILAVRFIADIVLCLFLGTAIYLRRLIAKQKELAILDENTLKRLKRDSHVLSYLITAILISTIARFIVTFTHYFWDTEDCQLIPLENDLVDAICDFIYSLCIHFLPLVIIISLFWLSKPIDLLQTARERKQSACPEDQIDDYLYSNHYYARFGSKDRLNLYDSDLRPDQQDSSPIASKTVMEMKDDKGEKLLIKEPETIKESSSTEKFHLKNLSPSLA